LLSFRTFFYFFNLIKSRNAKRFWEGLRFYNTSSVIRFAANRRQWNYVDLCFVSLIRRPVRRSLGEVGSLLDLRSFLDLRLVLSSLGEVGSFMRRR